MRPVFLQPAAEADLDAACEWYAALSSSLVDGLLSEFLEVSAMVSAHPKAFTEVEPGARRALLSRFPYSVIFAIEEDRVEIIAVVHSHRDPDVWKRRM